ncbi:MAG: dihydropteroate synthase [Micropepsaceae bacterium]
MNTAVRPQVFGIVNITSDSFSDGGKYLAPDKAVAHARNLLAGGADVLDVGAAASNPTAEYVPPEEEIRRLAPLLAADIDRRMISIDTFAPETQAWALTQGVGWLNDIQGFPDPAIYSRLATSPARLIVMHNISGRGVAQYTDTDPAAIFDILFKYFDARLSAMTMAGIDRNRIVLDPGMGHFLGKDPEVSLTVLRSLKRLKDRYNLPLMISVSRKSFIRKMAGVGVSASGPATLSAELFATSRGADIIRTHDVTALKHALDVWVPLNAA